NAFSTVVPAGDGALPVNAENAILRGLDDRRQMCLPLCRLHFVRDIDKHAHPVADGATGVRHRHTDIAYPAHAAILPDEPVLHLERFTHLDTASILRCNAGTISRMDDVGPVPAGLPGVHQE